MTRKFLTGAAILAFGATLAACGGGGGSKMTVTDPPVTTAKFEAQFGGKFATAYQGPTTGEPVDVAAGDVIAVNPTAEPVPFPGT